MSNQRKAASDTQPKSAETAIGPDTSLSGPLKKPSKRRIFKVSTLHH